MFRSLILCGLLLTAVAALADSPVAGEDWAVPQLGLELVWIQDLGIWAGKYTVTNREFREFRPGHTSYRYRDHDLDGADQPAVHLSYADALEFCEWLTRRERSAGRLPEDWEFRLPGSDEWLLLARCGTTREFPWGDAMPPSRGNFSDETAARHFAFDWIVGYDDGFAVTAPVQQSGVNEWGLYGLGGNVREWTTGVVMGQQILRGSTWIGSNPEVLKLEFLHARPATAKEHSTGFRVILAEVGSS